MKYLLLSCGDLNPTFEHFTVEGAFETIQAAKDYATKDCAEHFNPNNITKDFSEWGSHYMLVDIREYFKVVPRVDVAFTTRKAAPDVMTTEEYEEQRRNDGTY